MAPMHDVPRASLKTIIQEYGEAVCDNPRRCEALLRDYCGAYRREIFVLLSALEEDIVDELRRTKSAPPTAQVSLGVLIPRLARTLHQATALSERAALWAVQVWSEALGLIDDATQIVPADSVLTDSQAAGSPHITTSAFGARLVHQITAHTGEVSGLAFSSDGQQLASVGLDAAACIWDVASGDEIASLKQRTGILTDVAWHPDGLSLALSSGDWGIYLWRWLDVGSTVPRLRGHRGCVTCLAYAGTETLASAGRDGVVHIWRIANEGTLQSTLRGHTDAIRDLAVSPDGGTLASAGGWDRTVRIWDLQRAQAQHQHPERRTLTGHAAQVTCVAFGAGDTAVGSGSWDETARLWDLQQGQELMRFSSQEETVRPISTLDIDPSGALLATGDWQGTIRLWHVGTQTLINTLTHPEAQGSQAAAEAPTAIIRSVTFSPGGNWLASADSGGTICLWRVDR
jgi:WD40 repeat protein